ncbi:uncharacterized lipoprotein [Colwellia chukchiensis]|uniref:Uncharacterized lipoprotein n=1 Tax=Colwellia chukchiensis TaxID=641665 RepID=A0A1H7IZ63_9GAMM|nr:YajG family lipoprotein [Colwellia chukchiensis]SEK66095.1 uncharacterized lipoprotein [Colwellia chukchiensis]
MKSVILKLLILSTTVTLLACSTPIQQVIVSPELQLANSNVFQRQPVQLSVQDLRTSNHIVQISRPDKAAQLYSAQQPIAEVINASLSTAFKANGMQIQAQANTQLDVIIDSAIIKVDQAMLKYNASNQMILRVVISNHKGNLTKTFKITGNSNGPLTADLAVLERDFNQQLAKLLTQIVQNQELQQFIL